MPILLCQISTSIYFRCRGAVGIRVCAMSGERLTRRGCAVPETGREASPGVGRSHWTASRWNHTFPPQPSRGTASLAATAPLLGVRPAPHSPRTSLRLPSWAQHPLRGWARPRAALGGAGQAFPSATTPPPVAAGVPPCAPPPAAAARSPGEMHLMQPRPPSARVSVSLPLWAAGGLSHPDGPAAVCHGECVASYGSFVASDERRCSHWPIPGQREPLSTEARAHVPATTWSLGTPWARVAWNPRALRQERKGGHTPGLGLLPVTRCSSLRGLSES